MKTFNTQSLHFLPLCGRLFVLLFGWMVASAGTANAETINFGEMKLSTPYELKNDFNDYEGYFVAPKDGTLTVNASNGCLMTVYSDVEFLNEIGYTHQFTATGESYDINVKEGTTYYFRKDFCMADGTIVLLMEETPEVTISKVTPAEGSVLDLSKGGQISVVFNRAFRADYAALVVGETTHELALNIIGATAAIDANSLLLSLMQNGTLAEGMPLVLRIVGVRAAADENIIYGKDGIVEIDFVCGTMPVMLVATEGIENNKFLSYWIPGDPASIITLKFSNALLSHEGRTDKAIATLSYGNMETEGNNYYTEVVPYMVDGNNVVLDLSGKLRRHHDMVETEAPFTEMYLKFSDVRAENGNFTYNESQGSLGTYSFTLPYEEISLDIISEFTPASGKSLEGVSEIELWVTNYEKVKHEAFVFTYTDADGKETEWITNDYTATADPDYEGAYIINIAVPTEVAKAKNVTLTAYHLQTADGIDHSEAFTATYNPNGVGIHAAEILTPGATDVYDLSGVCVLRGGTKAQILRLPAGIYVINGSKHIVK